MAEEHRKLGYRVPKTLRDAFGAKCRAEGSTASQQLRLLMQAYIDGNITLTEVRSVEVSVPSFMAQPAD